MIQEDGKKRQLVVGVVRANHKLHKSAGESNDTIGYYTSDGHLLNACEKKETKSGQPVEGIAIKSSLQNRKYLKYMELGSISHWCPVQA